MGQTATPNLNLLDAKSLEKAFSDLRRAIDNFDLDDGWEVLASPKKHRLGITPGFVQVQVSDDKRGADYTTIHPDSINSTEISFTSAKAYMRVLADL